MPSPNPDALDAARSTLNDLTKERERVDGRLTAIASERERTAHSALTGDATAREQLESLKQEAAVLADHRKDVEAAIAQAERNFNNEWDAECRKEEVAAAGRKKMLAVSLRAAGKRADRGAREFAEALSEIEAITRDPDAAGITFLEFLNVRPHMMNCAHTAFMPVQKFMDPRSRRFFAPENRHSFSSILGTWAKEIETSANRVIAGKAPATKKEAA